MRWMNPVPHSTGSFPWWVQKFRAQHCWMSLFGRQKKAWLPHWWGTMQVIANYPNLEKTSWRKACVWMIFVPIYASVCTKKQFLCSVCSWQIVVIYLFLVCLLSLRVCDLPYFPENLFYHRRELHVLAVGYNLKHDNSIMFLPVKIKWDSCIVLHSGLYRVLSSEKLPLKLLFIQNAKSLNMTLDYLLFNQIAHSIVFLDQ